MTFEVIETFLMAVRTKNITKTAEALFLSQPTVSHRLKSLEEELGLRLLNRKKGFKQIELTSSGEAFLPIAERWLSLWQDTRLLQHRDDRLDLSIGCTDTINAALFMGLYLKLTKETNPGIRLKIKTHYSSELYALLERHEIDIGFVYHYLQYRNIITEPIIRERMCVVKPFEMGRFPEPGSAKKVHEQIKLSELDPEREIFLNWETNYQIWHDQWIGQGRRPSVQIDTYELLVRFMTEEKRWCIAPKSVAEHLESRCPVAVYEINAPVLPPERSIYKIRHKYPSESKMPALELFEARLSVYLAERGWGITQKETKI